MPTNRGLEVFELGDMRTPAQFLLQTTKDISRRRQMPIQGRGRWTETAIA